MLKNGLYKKTDTTICLFILPGVVAEGPFYHSVNSDCRYYAGLYELTKEPLQKLAPELLAQSGSLASNFRITVIGRIKSQFVFEGSVVCPDQS